MERYAGHDSAIVLTQDNGVFKERPMTLAERLARGPAAKIQDDIYRHANQAGICYYELWKLISEAIQTGIDKAGIDKYHEDDFEGMR